MTDAEALKKWQEHWPFERASQELIKRIQRIHRINNTAAKKFDRLVEEAGEAP